MESRYKCTCFAAIQARRRATRVPAPCRSGSSYSGSLFVSNFFVFCFCRSCPSIHHTRQLLPKHAAFRLMCTVTSRIVHDIAFLQPQPHLIRLVTAFYSLQCCIAVALSVYGQSNPPPLGCSLPFNFLSCAVILHGVRCALVALLYSCTDYNIRRFKFSALQTAHRLLGMLWIMIMLPSLLMYRSCWLETPVLFNACICFLLLTTAALLSPAIVVLYLAYQSSHAKNTGNWYDVPWLSALFVDAPPLHGDSTELQHIGKL